MGTRFVAVFVLFICIFAANISEGNRKVAENFPGNGGSSDVWGTDKDKAEQVWNYCRNKLKDCTEAVKDLDLERRKSPSSSYGVRFGSTLLVGRIMRKGIADLPPEKKQIFLDCLREKNFPLQVRDELETLSNKYQKLFSGWASLPRRFLRRKWGIHQILRTAITPGPAFSPAYLATGPISASPPSPVLQPPSVAPELAHEPSDTDYSPKLTKNVSPVPSQDNNNHTKYIAAAVVAGAVAGLALLAIVLLLCLNKERRVEPKDGQRDENPLLNFGTGQISAGSSQKFHTMGNPSSKDLKSPSIAGSSLDVNHDSSQTESQSMEAHAEALGKTAALPLPPGRTAPPPAAPPPPPPKPPAPAPPPPPKVGRRPPNPPAPAVPAVPSPLGPHHRRSSTGGASQHSDDSEAPKTKLKPFFWDKVLASPNHSMVWHEIKAGSFQFDEGMMESLFGYVPADKNKNEHRKDSSSSDSPHFIQIIDPKKSQNLAILLKALNVTTEEVCDALKEGNELPPELIQTLLKMKPTSDEELKLRLYIGDVSHLSPAERFLKVIVDIPYAYKRLESLLFVNTFQEEFSSLKESFATLEVACKELRNSRLFLKLLEAVLKTGNRMNDGTYRGGAQAFKLDTLLKLSDVKGTDGKTTLLNFVVLEIIRSEGVRAARKLRECPSMSSVRTEDLVEDSPLETEEYHRTLGLQVVSGLSNELENVRKAATIDNENLVESVSKLRHSLVKTKDFLDTEMKSLEEESSFCDALISFINQSESDITWLIEEEKRIMALVRSTGDYFHGKAGREDGLHLFLIVRDFLLMVDKACKEVKISPKSPSKPPKKEASSSSPPPSQESQSESSLDIHRRLFPAIMERRMDDDDDDDDFSSDDDS